MARAVISLSSDQMSSTVVEHNRTDCNGSQREDAPAGVRDFGDPQAQADPPTPGDRMGILSGGRAAICMLERGIGHEWGTEARDRRAGAAVGGNSPGGLSETAWPNRAGGEGSGVRGLVATARGG